MTVEEIQLDKKIVEQIVDDMDLFDDDLMAMVFDGNNLATGLLLKIILKRDDITVISVVGQRAFQKTEWVITTISKSGRGRKAHMYAGQDLTAA